jgi:hypothetical protein
MSNFNYVEKLQKDIDLLNDRINPSKLQIIKRCAIKTMLNLGIAVEYSLPIILAFMIIFSVREKTGKIPFKIDKVVDKISTEVIDTSTGIHVEFISKDNKYDKNSIEYSTGWELNELGLYERHSTIFQVDDDVDLTDSESILLMSEDELKNKFSIQDIKTITKSHLDDLDNIYNEDTIVVTSSKSLLNNFVRDETNKENILDSIIYVFSSLCLGGMVDALYFKAIGKKINSKIKSYKESFGPFNEEEVNYMLQMLEIKEANLKLFDDSDYEYDNNFTYRKVRR